VKEREKESVHPECFIPKKICGQYYKTFQRYNFNSNTKS
jgi:hypothetical protein